MSKPFVAAQPSDSIPSTRLSVGPTVEQALYALLLALALLLRFLRLGSAAPLNPLEAGQAWVAWAGAFGHDGMIPALAHSPLLYTAQRFLFWLTDGGGDGWARLVPALVGGLILLVAWLLRGTLGKPTALALALFLAVDPWLLTFSRMGDGAILSVGLGLLLVAAFAQRNELTPAALRGLVVVAGLFLISGPVAWLLLPVVGGAIALFGGVSRWPREQSERARLLSIGGVTIVAGATGMLSHWDGLGTISTSLGVALDSLHVDSGYSLGWAFMRLAVDQPLALLMGLAGLITLWLQRDVPLSAAETELGGGSPWRLFLTGWTAWGLLLLLLPGRNPTTLLVIGLPLLISATWTASRLWAYATRQVNWQDGSLIAVTLAVLLVTTGFWTSHYSNEWGSPDFDGLTLLFYAILPLLGLFFVWWAGWRTSSQIAGLVGLALLFLMSLGSGWSLNLPGDTTKGSALFAETVLPGMGALAEDISRLSAMRALDPHEAPVLVHVPLELQSLMGWNLRSMRQLRFVDGINPAFLSDRTALVVADEAIGPSLPGGYRGSHYGILQRWLPTDLSGSGPIARWILLRELKSNLPATSVVLWAREE